MTSHVHKKNPPTPSFTSLESRCRHVLVLNLERYPPEAIGVLDEQAWESVIRYRHYKTRPQTPTTGGLDGTGRMTPAISSKYLQSVEEANPHLRESVCADELVWKDCVEHRFKRGGILRPRSLNLPWPQLLESLQTAKSNLSGLLKQQNEDSMRILYSTIQTLEESPMNVALLQTTGVGKGVKQFLKACNKNRDLVDIWTVRNVKRKSISPETQLKQVLQKWMTIAQANGVVMSSSASSSDDNTANDDQKQDEEGLRMAQQCQSWRKLYTCLSSREKEVRANQGARMREIRKNLDKDRPKIVKVRPTNPKHGRMLEKRSMQPKYAATAPAAASKMQQIRAESAVQASWSKSPAKSKLMAAGKRPPAASFGSAVAFASGDTKKKRKNATATISLGGGKHMKVTKKSIKGTGGFAAAVRKNPSTLTNRPKTWRK